MTALLLPSGRTSHLPHGRRQRITTALVLTTGFLWLLAPRAHGAFTNHLHKEDGTVFLTDALRGFPLLETYTGYLHMGPRLSAEVCAVLPGAAFAPCAAAVSAGTRTALSVLILMVLLPHLGKFSWALAAACMPLVGGVGQQEVLGNITNLRWFLDVGVVFCLIGVFRQVVPICFAGVFAMVAALSDPLALVAAPLAVWRILTAHGAGRTVPCLYGVAMLTHLVLLRPSSRPVEFKSIVSEPVLFGQNLVVRSFTEAMTGESGSQLAITVLGVLPVVAATTVLAVLFLAGSWRFMARNQRILVVLLWGCGALVTLGTICFTDPRSIDVGEGVSRASRYALAPSILIGCGVLVVLSSVPRRGLWKAIGTTVCGVLILSAVVDSRGDEWSTRGPQWSTTVDDARRECSSGAMSVTVPVTPQGVPTRWTADLRCSWVAR